MGIKICPYMSVCLSHFMVYRVYVINSFHTFKWNFFKPCIFVFNAIQRTVVIRIVFVTKDFAVKLNLLLLGDFIGPSKASEMDTLEHLFSSPEHEVLMVSYCDQSMSVVRHPSCVVNNLF